MVRSQEEKNNPPNTIVRSGRRDFVPRLMMRGARTRQEGAGAEKIGECASTGGEACAEPNRRSDAPLQMEHVFSRSRFPLVPSFPRIEALLRTHNKLYSIGHFK